MFSNSVVLIAFQMMIQTYWCLIILWMSPENGIHGIQGDKVDIIHI